jgi:hypothetical protein
MEMTIHIFAKNIPSQLFIKYHISMNILMNHPIRKIKKKLDSYLFI